MLHENILLVNTFHYATLLAYFNTNFLNCFYLCNRKLTAKKPSLDFKDYEPKVKTPA